jgi:hypothetical protein
MIQWHESIPEPFRTTTRCPPEYPVGDEKSLAGSVEEFSALARSTQPIRVAALQRITMQDRQIERRRKQELDQDFDTKE